MFVGLLLLYYTFNLFHRCKTAHVTLESSKSNAADKKSKASEKKVEKKSVKPGGDKKAAAKNANDPEKFRLYFNFSIPVKYAKPHQVRIR